MHPPREARPLRDAVVTKPEIRYSGIVDVEFGKNVSVVEPVNLYGCAIGDGSFVGPFVEIQKGAVARDEEALALLRRSVQLNEEILNELRNSKK